MSAQPSDSITLDLEETENFLRRSDAVIRRGQARTANVLSYILVGALVMSLPLYILVVAYLDVSKMASADKIFEKWYHIVSPLAGAAVGAYYVSHTRRSAEQKP